MYVTERGHRGCFWTRRDPASQRLGVGYAIREAGDLTKVLFTNRSSQLDDEDLGLRTATRKFLREDIVSAEDDACDALEDDARRVIPPATSAKS